MDQFVPTLYLKQHCPFCLKARIAVLEAGLSDRVRIREFAPGTSDETEIRDELAPHLEKITFPAAEIEPGTYIADSDEIVTRLLESAGTSRDNLPVLESYVSGPFASMMRLFRENKELKAAAS